MSSPSPPSNIAFKIRGKDSYNRFTLAAGESLFDRLLEALREREITYKALYWIDEEGDRIALRSVLDMQDAISAGNRLVRLEAEKQPEVLVQEGSNTPLAVGANISNDRSVAHRTGRRHRRSRSRSPRLTNPMLKGNARYSILPNPTQVYWSAPTMSNSPAHPFCRYCKQ